MADEVKETLETPEQTPDPKNTGGAEGNAGGQKPETKPMTFDEFLKSNKEYQAEFDRRLNKATSTAVSNAQERWQAAFINSQGVSKWQLTLLHMQISYRARLIRQPKENSVPVGWTPTPAR